MNRRERRGITRDLVGGLFPDDYKDRLADLFESENRGVTHKMVADVALGERDPNSPEVIRGLAKQMVALLVLVAAITDAMVEDK